MRLPWLFGALFFGVVFGWHFFGFSKMLTLLPPGGDTLHIPLRLIICFPMFPMFATGPYGVLYINVVRCSKNACSCSVFCSMFDSECVRTACSGLNVFGFWPPGILFVVRPSLLVFCSVFEARLCSSPAKTQANVRQRSQPLQQDVQCFCFVSLFGRSCSDISLFAFGLYVW